MKKIKNKLSQIHTYITIISFLSTAFIQCKTTSNNFYPLQVKSENIYTSRNNKFIRVLINGHKSFNGKIYTQIETMGYFYSDSRDTTFYRKKTDKVVLEYLNFENIIYPKIDIPDSILRYFDFKSNEQIRYNFDIGIGQSYPILIKISDIKANGLNTMALATMTLVSKNETVMTKNKKYENCVKFDYEFLTASDFEFSEWFTEGIGLVKIEFNNSKQSFTLKN